MFNLREYQHNPEQLADHLPWALLVASGVVEQKDGLLQKTIAFRGPDMQSCGENQLASTCAQVNNALKRLGSGWSLFVEARRTYCSSYPTSPWPNWASEQVDKERQHVFENVGQHFDSQYHLTFVYAPPTQQQNQFSAWFLGDKDTSQYSHEENLKTFLQQVQRTLQLFKCLFPYVHELNDEETLTYLHSTISPKSHRVAVPPTPMYLDAFLPDAVLQHGLETRLGDLCLRTLTVRAFPGSTFAGILSNLNELACEYRWVSRYIAFGQQEALAEIYKYRKRWYAKRKSLSSIVGEVATQTESGLGDTDALRKAEDADHALQQSQDDVTSFGHLTITVTTWGNTPKQADERIGAIEAAINTKGFTTHLETLNSTEAWLSSLPGHVYANVRRPIVSSLNLVHLLPLSAVWSGPQRNEHLKGPPHFMAQTSGGTPFRLSTAVGDVGHTLILGPTGAGKSTLLAFMALQWLRYKNAQVVFFDKGGSVRAATLAVNGQYYAPGCSKGGLTFQPLSCVDEPSEQRWALQWLTGICQAQGVQMNSENKKELWYMLANLATRPAPDRTLTIAANLLQNASLTNALLPFCLQGPYGHLFDAAQDTLSTGAWQTFEMEILMQQPQAIAPALSYLFHRLQQRFDGCPTLLVLDEAWLFLDHPLFAEKIREWLKVLRKANVYVIFATQSLADAMDSSIAPALLESCPTKIFLPNPSAQEPQMQQFYQRMGLSDRQMQIIAQAVPKREYYVDSRLGNRLFELQLGPTALAFCAASSKDDHRLMDRVLQAHPQKDFAKQWLRCTSSQETVDNIPFTANTDGYEQNTSQ